MKKKMERIHVQMDKELVERIAEKQAEIKEKTGLRCSRSFIVRELVNENIENFMNEPENGTRMTHDSTTFQDATAQEWHTDDTTFPEEKIVTENDNIKENGNIPTDVIIRARKQYVDDHKYEPESDKDLQPYIDNELEILEVTEGER